MAGWARSARCFEDFMGVEKPPDVEQADENGRSRCFSFSSLRSKEIPGSWAVIGIGGLFGGIGFISSH